jgi:hypothetical protein
MNDSYGNTDRSTPEPTASRPRLPAPELLIEAESIDAEPIDAEPIDVELLDVEQIDEADIRILAPYSSESDGQTLVGIGPAVRLPGRKSAPRASAEPPKAALEPPSSLQPVAIAAGSWSGEAEEPTPRFRNGLGIWGIALPALLVAAGVAVALLRSLGASHSLSERDRANASAAAATSGTAGLAVALAGADVRVFLDGQDRGRPPVLLTELAPGSHSLSITGPAFAPFEQPVLLVAGHVSTVEPKLTLVHGAIELALGQDADGASVEVVGGNERRQVGSLPAHLDAGPGDYVVRAKKPGFAPFETTVALSATSPEAHVVIELTRGGALAAGHGKSTDASEATLGAAVDGTGNLSITSSPPALVVLDGHLLGKSPRSLEVPAGSHTVAFVHPKFGRKSVTVNVPPDQTTSASADF